MRKLVDEILFVTVWVLILFGVPLLILMYIRILYFIVERLGLDFWK